MTEIHGSLRGGIHVGRSHPGGPRNFGHIIGSLQGICRRWMMCLQQKNKKTTAWQQQWLLRRWHYSNGRDYRFVWEAKASFIILFNFFFKFLIWSLGMCLTLSELVCDLLWYSSWIAHRLCLIRLIRDWIISNRKADAFQAFQPIKTLCERTDLFLMRRTEGIDRSRWSNKPIHHHHRQTPPIHQELQTNNNKS